MNPTDLPVHWTNLAKIGMSPAHYLAAIQAKLDDTLAMRIGRLVHQIVLGGPPSAVWNGKRQGKAWEEWEAQQKAAGIKEIVTISEVTTATRIARAVQADPIAAPFLVGDTEKALEWTGIMGRKCATRGVDVLGDTFITDLKKTRCAEPEKFNRDARWRCYHAQLAWYRDGVRAVFKRDFDTAYIVGVEEQPPHCVTVLRVGPEALEEGERINRLWMERLLSCEAVDEWPGYVQSVVDFTLWKPEQVAPLDLIVNGEPFDFEAA